MPEAEALPSFSGGSRIGDLPEGGGSSRGAFTSGSSTGGLLRGGFRGARRFEGPRGRPGGTTRVRRPERDGIL